MSKKNKQTTMKPEGKIKHMLRTNYWLTPLLLVALVFALVFGISKIPALSDTIKGWFSKHEECEECTTATYEEFQNKLQNNEDGKIFYVLVTSEGCEGCDDFYPVLDKFLATNSKDNSIDIIVIDITIDEDEKYNDSTLDDAKLEGLKTTIKDFNNGDLVAPSIIKYEGKNIKDIHSGATKDYNALKDFFNI